MEILIFLGAAIFLLSFLSLWLLIAGITKAAQSVRATPTNHHKIDLDVKVSKGASSCD